LFTENLISLSTRRWRRSSASCFSASWRSNFSSCTLSSFPFPELISEDVSAAVELEVELAFSVLPSLLGIDAEFPIILSINSSLVSL
jgi:hypothetical protein